MSDNTKAVFERKAVDKMYLVDGLDSFNGASEPYDREREVQELFEAQVRWTPDEVAVVFEGEHLSYAQLNRRANRLARYLLEQGVVADTPVGVCLIRSPQMVVAVLAVLKAGAAYLPLDPNYPAARLQHMLRDAAPTMVLTQRELQAAVSESAPSVVALEDLGELPGFAAENLCLRSLRAAADNLVYVIYTSGSTGRPKGTAMRHTSMVNLLEWHRRSFGSAEGVRVLQFAALSFDVAFQEIFSTLCTGGTLVLLDEWVRRDAAALSQYLERHAVARLFIPPLMLQSLAEYCSETGRSPAWLCDVIAAGEPLRVVPEVVEFFKRLPKCRLHNHYGPTETHVVTALTLDGNPQQWPALPSIGRPIANARIYVLDEECQTAPPGVAGEIYIGGVCVARGYLGRPELTAQRFVADPYSREAPARSYRTGDLGRWRADGTLEYLGRNDEQVKLRGYRIELGEIEAQLAQHGGVKEAAVIVREDAPGQKRLVAYFTERDSGVQIEELREHLKGVLPEHMVPGAFMRLHRLPLTPNGKLDRRGLPAPQLDAYVTREYKAPRGELEEVLAGIWSELLKVERVGRHDNFFELGGHSMLIVQVMARLRRLGLNVDLRSFYTSGSLTELARELRRERSPAFEVPANRIPKGCEFITPDMLPLVELTAAQIEQITRCVPGGAANIQDIYPLAPLQEGILFHQATSSSGSESYVIEASFEIASRARLEEFVASISALIDEHDALRAAVLWEGLPRPMQVILREVALQVHEIQTTQPAKLTIDLSNPPLCTLLAAENRSEGHWRVVLRIHHLICDNDSLQMLLLEIGRRLTGINSRRISVPYRNYVANALRLAEGQEIEAFFGPKLADFEEPSAPFGVTNIHGDGSDVREEQRVIDAQLVERARLKAKSFSIGVAGLLHATWACVVAATSGRQDVIFGTVLSGRIADSEGALAAGMFINTLPVRLKLDGVSAGELVKAAHREIAEIMSFQQAPLSRVQRCSGIQGAIPLFTTLLNYVGWDGAPHELGSIADGVRLLSVNDRTNYPIVLTINDGEDSFRISVQTSSTINPARIADSFEITLVSLIEALEEYPERFVHTISTLPGLEKLELIEELNATQRPVPSADSVHQLFEGQARRTPDSIAVECLERALTYKTLNDSADVLAQKLHGMAVSPDDRVGLCLQRGASVIVGLLGILKAGAAYLPLDPEYPSERLKQMIYDAAPRAIVTDESLRELLSDWDANLIIVEDRPTDGKVVVSKPANSGTKGHHLAYVIYTSGSTGRPKGVMVEHRNVLNFLHLHIHNCQLTASDRVLQFASYAFDASVEEIFPPLTVGATLVLRPRGLLVPDDSLLSLITSRRLTIVDVPTAFWHHWVEQISAEEDYESLRLVVIGGEKAERQSFDKWRETACGRRTTLLNTYGPTEATVYATSFTVESDTEVPAGEIPIGCPVANVQVFILDSHRQLVPKGVVGEIYLGGEGIARGYLNRSDLSAERFLPNPFSMDPLSRIYRTGDLGRWRLDRTIEYVGRHDRQIKLRGFRIELGEIEARLIEHDQVSEAVVVVREDGPGGAQLVAYIVAAGGGTAPAAEVLRQYLQALLPNYMVPSAFVMLDDIPLTPSGKIDRRALPVPDEGAYASAVYEKPQGVLEETLAEVWCQTLGIEVVGRDDEFFAIGGHSLLAMQIRVHIRSRLAVEVPVAALFSCPTIRKLASEIQRIQIEKIRDKVTTGDRRANELLEEVKALSASEAREMIRRIKTEGRA